MHEAGLIRNVLSMAAEEARSRGGKNISAIRLRVGAIAGVIPQALDFAFEALRPGTAASAARLEVEYVPLRYACAACKTAFAPTAEGTPSCPECKGRELEVQGGTELTLVGIEVT